MTKLTTSRFTAWRAGIAAGLLLAFALTGCGGGSSNDDEQAATIPVSEWVAAFDQLCVETAAKLSADLSEAEFREISESALVEMKAIPSPDEQAAETKAMLEAIEATTTDATLDDAAITAYDQQFLDAATELGVSEACIGGAAD